MAPEYVTDSDLAKEDLRIFWAMEQTRTQESPCSSPVTILRKETWPWGVQEAQRLSTVMFAATLIAMILAPTDITKRQGDTSAWLAGLSLVAPSKP